MQVHEESVLRFGDHDGDGVVAAGGRLRAAWSGT
jgi:hypothetical protein